MAADGGSDAPDDETDETIDGFLQRVARVSERPLQLVSAVTAPTLASPPPERAGDAAAHLPTVPREHYAVVTEYGRGGMGRVLLARDRRLQRRVAVKELLRKDAHDVTRFVREAVITAGLQHPGIVPVHEAGYWPTGEPFYAMKLASGRPLSILIDEAKTLAARLTLLPALIAVADAIAYAHSQRVIHRDLKPSNVMVGEFGEVLVIDWGLAKLLDAPETPEPEAAPAPDTPQATAVGALVGTPGFMSPEQAAGAPADERSDVFGLGAMLYTLLSGRLPFRGRQTLQILEETRLGSPTPLAEVQPGVPADLVAIVDKALARRPEDRYRDARELAADLKRFSTGQLVGAQRYSRAQRLWRWTRRHRGPVSVAAVALVLLAVLAGVSVRQIVRERNRADAERLVALERVDQLIVSQARASVDADPTLALAWLKRLGPSSRRWAEARVVAAQADQRHAASDVLDAEVAAFSPDGAWLALADGEARVWLRDGEGRQQELPVGVGVARAIAFSADGARVALGGSGGVRLYDLRSRQPIPLDGAVEEVTALAFLDGSTPLLAVAARDGLHLWDARGRAREAPRVPGALRGLAAARDRLVVRSDGGLFSWQPDKTLQRRAGGGDRPFTLSADGARLAISDGSAVEIVTLDGGAARRLLTGAVSAVALDSRGERLAVCSSDGRVTTYAADGRETKLAHVGEACRAVVLSADGNELVATRGTTVRAYDVASQAVRKLRGHARDVVALALSSDGRRLATGDGERVRLWDIAAPPPRHAPVGVPLALSPDGARIVTGATDGSVIVRDAAGAEQTIGRHAAPLRDLAWSGSCILSAAGDGMELHILGDAPLLAALLPTVPTRVALACDAGVLATVDGEGMVSLQPLAHDGLRFAASGKPRPLASLAPPGTLALSPDGRRLAYAGAHAHAAYVVPVRGGETRSFASVDEITALAFADEDTLAVGQANGALGFVSLSSGAAWTRAESDAAPIVAIAFAPSVLTTVSADGRWQVQRGLPPRDAAELRRFIDRLTRARLDDDDQLR